MESRSWPRSDVGPGAAAALLSQAAGLAGYLRPTVSGVPRHVATALNPAKSTGMHARLCNSYTTSGLVRACVIVTVAARPRRARPAVGTCGTVDIIDTQYSGRYERGTLLPGAR